jgi:hypothetical protein
MPAFYVKSAAGLQRMRKGCASRFHWILKPGVHSYNNPGKRTCSLFRPAPAALCKKRKHEFSRAFAGAEAPARHAL